VSTVELPASDVRDLVLLGVAVAVAVGLAGWVVLRGLRGAALRAQVVVIALVPVLGTTLGVLYAARAMFASSHDLDVLLVVTISSGVAALVVALGLGRRVLTASAALGELTRRIGEEPTHAPRVAGAEFALLARQLEDMSARLDESRERERLLESSRRELVAWVSHDLRTPLAGIRAMVEALDDGVVDDASTVARYHHTMKLEADKLAGLVDDLFELSRIEADALQLTIERVSLGDLVSDALASAAVVAEAKGVRLSGELREPAPTVDLSTPEMSRVVRNLLDNAIRHTPPGGHVVVETGGDDGHAFVSVADTCGGIPDDEIGRVFELAFRGDAARTPAVGGAGLGLAIARGLVEAHSGEIDVRNEGAGCCFTVRLPLTHAS
jgi:signal transduction histidine kinase